jgi:hypothetical protein
MIRSLILLFAIALALGGCSLFGCAGVWAGGSAGAGGCTVGTRF